MATGKIDNSVTGKAMDRSYSRFFSGLVHSYRLAKLSHTAVKVLVTLDAHCKPDWRCVISNRSIAKKAGVSPSTVWKAIQELIDAGLLSCEVRWDNRNPQERDTNRYQILAIDDQEGGVSNADTPCTDSRDTVYQFSGDGVSAFDTIQIDSSNPNNKQISHHPPTGGSGIGGSAENGPGFGNTQDQPKAKPTKAKGRSDPRVKEFIDWFAQEYNSEFGKGYFIAWGKDCNLVKQLLTVFTPEQLMDATKAMFNDKWTRDKSSIGLLHNQINRLTNVNAGPPPDESPSDLLRREGVIQTRNPTPEELALIYGEESEVSNHG